MIPEKFKSKEWFTIKEAAEIACVSEKTIRRKINSGELKAKKVGGRWRIMFKDLMEFLGKEDTIEPEKLAKLEEEIARQKKLLMKLLYKYTKARVDTAQKLVKINPKQAIAILTDIAEELKYFSDLLLKVSVILWEAGKKHIAIKLLETSESPEAKIQLAKFYYSAGEPQKALEILANIDKEKLSNDLKSIIELLYSLILAQSQSSNS